MKTEVNYHATTAKKRITAALRRTRVRFEKPMGWTFKAGQYLDMTLLDPSETDSEGNVRSFSIARGPHEETLMVATRMRDTAFKRVLRRCRLGPLSRSKGHRGT